MADTFTVNYNWTKPSVGGDSTTWGSDLNTDLDGIDATVFAVSGVANAALPSSGFTAAIVLTMIKTVDGSGSGLDADKLDGQEGSFYQNAGNLNAGTVPMARVPATVMRWTNSFTSANVTVSSGVPSGGSPGDIWIQV